MLWCAVIDVLYSAVKTSTDFTDLYLVAGIMFPAFPLKNKAEKMGKLYGFLLLAWWNKKQKQKKNTQFVVWHNFLVS